MKKTKITNYSVSIENLKKMIENAENNLKNHGGSDMVELVITKFSNGAGSTFEMKNAKGVVRFLDETG